MDGWILVHTYTSSILVTQQTRKKLIYVCTILEYSTLFHSRKSERALADSWNLRDPFGRKSSRPPSSDRKSHVCGVKTGKFYENSTFLQTIIFFQNCEIMSFPSSWSSYIGFCEAFGLDDGACEENPCSSRLEKLFLFQVFTILNILIVAMPIQKHQCDILFLDLWTGPCRRAICYNKWFKHGGE